MDAPLAILFEDEHVLAVDKPPGRLVIPGRSGPERTLQEELQQSHGRLWIVHRLDRGTSGVLLFARSAAAHRELNLAFDRQQIAKRYLAIVRGAPQGELHVEVPIAPARRGRMRPARRGDDRGKAAATDVAVMERFSPRRGLPALALVEVRPRTGRTHQIRVHLAAAGFPLAVDPDYGDPEPLVDDAGRILLARTPLHASRLELQHPASGRRLAIEAPLPPDLEAVLALARGG